MDLALEADVDREDAAPDVLPDLEADPEADPDSAEPVLIGEEAEAEPEL